VVQVRAAPVAAHAASAEREGRSTSYEFCWRGLKPALLL
jgi:hypothetical protein